MLRASLLAALCASVSCFVVPPCNRQEQLGSDGKEGFYFEGAIGPKMQCEYNRAGCVIFNKEKNEKMYVPFGEYADTGTEIGFRKRCYAEKKGTTITYGTKFEGCIVSSQLVAMNSVAKVGQHTYNCSCTETWCSMKSEVTPKPTKPICHQNGHLGDYVIRTVYNEKTNECEQKYIACHTWQRLEIDDIRSTIFQAGETCDTSPHFGYRELCAQEGDRVVKRKIGCTINSKFVEFGAEAEFNGVLYKCTADKIEKVERALTCNTEPKMGPMTYSVEELSNGKCLIKHGCVHTSEDGNKTLIPANQNRDTATHFGFRVYCSASEYGGMKLDYKGCMINGEFFKLGDEFMYRGVQHKCHENKVEFMSTLPTCSDEKEIYAMGVLYRVEQLNKLTNRCEKVIAGCVYTDKQTGKVFHIPLGDHIDTDTRHGYRMQCTRKSASSFGTDHIGCVIDSEFFQIGETRVDHSERVMYRCEQGILRPVGKLEVTTAPKPINPSGLCTYIDQETRQEKQIPFGETFDSNPIMGHRLECFKEGNVSGTRSVACIFGGKAYKVGERGVADIGFAKLLVECGANFTHHVVQIL